MGGTFTKIIGFFGWNEKIIEEMEILHKLKERYIESWYALIELIDDENLINELIDQNNINWNKKQFLFTIDMEHQELGYRIFNYLSHTYDDNFKRIKPIIYDYRKIRERNKDINREFCEFFWHPKRMDLWIWQEEEDLL